MLRWKPRSLVDRRRLPHQRQDERRDDTLGIPEGVWTSRGYGYVIFVSNETISLLEETAISCILNNDLLEGIEGILVEGDTATIEVGTNAPYKLDRTDSFQSGCANGLTPVLDDANYTRDALVNFDILDQTFTEHYGFFELRGIDWEALTMEARINLSSNSTDLELYEAFVALMDPLDDGHVFFASDEFEYVSKPSGIVQQFEEEFDQQTEVSDPDIYIQTQFVAWIQIVAGYMQGGLNRKPTGFFWGQFTGTSVGYLLFLDFGAEDDEEFDRDLDEVFLALSGSSAIVVDLRANSGGGDTTALVAASHFAAERTLAYTQRTVFGDGLTNPDEVFIEPEVPANRHDGEVIVIVSGSTVSAGETFSIAMKQLPQTTFLGRNTSGAFSDILLRNLPNGWEFGLSNEIHAAPDGTVYEMVGIPPDIVPPAEVLELSEREAGIDSWLELALESVQIKNATLTPSISPTQASHAPTLTPAQMPTGSPLSFTTTGSPSDSPTASSSGGEKSIEISLWGTVWVATIVWALHN